MTKAFHILREKFQHAVAKVAPAFEAVAVICQYKVENDEPLFDILVDDVINGGPDVDNDNDDWEIFEPGDI